MPEVKTKQSEHEPREMSFFDHLEELRKHIMRSLMAIVAAGVALYIFKDWVFDTVIFGPSQKDFISYRVFCSISQWLGLGNALCLTPPEVQMQAVGFGEAFLTTIRVSFMGGIVVSFPFIINEFWKFIRPGLYDNERSVTRGVVFICSGLFLLGVFFGYFILAPFATNFLLGYTIPGVENKPTLISMINYMVMFILPAGLVFELPIVVYFLSRIGLVTPEDMRKYRRHAIVIILIVSGIITPPDVVTQTLLGFPLFLLYELSIFISARVQRQLAQKEALEEAEARR
ncbi:MAG: twin-arginine translocase subunit TatC [Saprospiraceae bacterium]|nr:twin-arginine translocase subunit TatC [Saprospiraceae bacterium]